MVKKKGKKFMFSNRTLYTLITIGVLIILGVGAYALTPGSAPNPGHLISDIAPPAPCGSGQFLQFSSVGTWVCATPSTGTSLPSCGSGQTVQFDGNQWVCANNYWTSVPSGITYNGGNVVFSLGNNITASGQLPSTSYTNFGTCNSQVTQDANLCLPGEIESNVITQTCTQNPDNFTYVSQRTCTSPGGNAYLTKIGFPDTNHIMVGGQIIGTNSGLSPYIHGYIYGPVGSLISQNHLIGTIPVSGAKGCFVFLAGFTEEHCVSGSCSTTRVAAASCSNSGTTVYGTFSGDGIGTSDGTVTCGYICW